MQLKSLLTPERTFCGVQGGSKKRVLDTISILIAKDLPYLNGDELFSSLIARERLGSTGLGHGVAIPHARIAGVDDSVGAVLKLRQGVDYDALDQGPVDLLFALLVPEDSTDEHLRILASLAEMFSDDPFRKRIRDCHGNGEIFGLMSERGSDS